MRVSRKESAPLLTALALVACTAAVLRVEGRVWWCVGDDARPWTSDAWGRHNSQHLFDPYAFTHLLHGLVFWGVLSFASRRISAGWRAVISLAVEAAWEILENSPWIIDRYRAATAAVGYTGDSVMNSLGDVVACGVGLVVASRLGWRRSTALFVATELLLLFWIRDSLLLNVIMLIHPIDAIRTWQAAGH